MAIASSFFIVPKPRGKRDNGVRKYDGHTTYCQLFLPLPSPYDGTSIEKHDYSGDFETMSVWNMYVVHDPEMYLDNTGREAQAGILNYLPGC